MSMSIDLNADVGESFGRYRLGDDAALIPLVTSVSIACGFHAGDPGVMRRTVELAAASGVAVGAHPGLPDLQGFGRRAMRVDPDELADMVTYQIGALAAFARAAGVPLRHVKAHGALYPAVAGDAALAEALVRAVLVQGRDLAVIGPAGPAGALLERAAAGAGLRFVAEAFVDRAYRRDGTLVPRGESGAVIASADEAAARAVAIARDGAITSATGERLPLRAGTLCIHGDAPAAVEVARRVRAALEAAGTNLAPLA
jgi:UPF0271 protein